MEEKKNKTVDVLIPTYRPTREFERLLDLLERQTHPPAHIRILNTEQSLWDFGIEERHSRILVSHISQEEFDHAASRARLARESESDYLLFMTQDAIPSNRYLIEELLEPFDEDGVRASYARQLPRGDCSELERRTRMFNYPAKSRIKSREDLPRLGIKTYFCSDVCALYERETFEKLGGFVDRAIFNEDMLYAAKVIQNGGKVAYAAAAKVIHSHNYTYTQQFHRNFDLGVSQAQNREIFRNLPSEGEGLRLVRTVASEFIEKKEWLKLPDLFFQCAFKYAGYLLGKNYRLLPKRILLKCTASKSYWNVR